MTTSQTQLDQALSEPQINKFWLGYFQEGFREEVHQQLLEIFETLKKSSGWTRSDLARKIGRRPEQVTRWLSAPTNLEIDTISDMALGMRVVPRLRFEPVKDSISDGKPNLTNPVADFVAASTASQTVLMKPTPTAATSYEILSRSEAA
ncbi:MAG: helix-turn-helix domain-containing protein [Hyphomicrobium sp.]|uniref:helix-turn-helix domain-containing protein n=1 Tax=Hyphomicrobium sp. TaxID=82 RepID=UPI0013294EA5|nr:helix-turn-helix transcriptional regulator [Hyphomicrobium sp.]KAB2940905.1 MAG: helix-turn-helix transcriptional regulator [Hyphomicrobium sp.]MBZ0211377.1 helix-turn-helix domain-containing protein [Hyphomicrobium sp.]